MYKDKINIGVVGSGPIVERFLDACKSIDKINLYAFYSRSNETAQSFKEKYSFDMSYTDLNKMSIDSELDAVYIASPNSCHHEQAILFLENKKHVLCEKALASNYKEALNMIETAKENNVVLLEAMRTTLLPNFLQVKNNLHKIGKIRRYFASFCQYSSRYDKFKEGIVLNAFKNELSNGSLMDIGVYCVHPLVNLFGAPNKVIASANMLHTGVDSQGSLILTYDDMDGVIMHSKVSNSYLPSEIQGEAGSIIIDKINNFSKVSIRYRDGSIEDLTLSQYENDMHYEIVEFINLILSKDTTNNATDYLDVSLKVMSVLDSARREINLVYPADKL